MNPIVIEQLAVTAELCGTSFSEPAVRVMVGHLEAYPDKAVLLALQRCQKEVRGRLSLADVIARIEDGRPGAEEAWAMIPRSEHETAVCTEEMFKALAACGDVDGEPIPARMAFKEAYERAVRDARTAGSPVKWRISLGWDESGRSGPVLEALEAGRITREQAAGAIGHLDGGREAIAGPREPSKRLPGLKLIDAVGNVREDA